MTKKFVKSFVLYASNYHMTENAVQRLTPLKRLHIIFYDNSANVHLCVSMFG